ncbi:hypothetical protein ATOP_13320 [Granulimonas faecalis]|uniref:Uncharacterized protein n=1 Tax=Granulimonas faecalis TaxID=2894155 RepID=A0AAV5B332_9ACTN|nr:hypothetical protein [Granulimonas faecalis]GJM55677.1 hypothetical protein ATOP_13320 [Granulimonas faecalis]
MDLTRYELMCTGPDGATDACRLAGCELDMAVSDDPDDNDFTLSCPASGFVPEVGAVVYVEGTEIGGVVEGRGADSAAASVDVVGRTWSGLLDARVLRPPAGQDYLAYSGDARAVVRQVLSACGLEGWFCSAPGNCGTAVSGRFDRYCTAWSGLRKELRRAGLRLSASWDGSRWVLDAVARRTVEVDASEARVTSDAGLMAYNHLVCAGEGELKDRVVVDLYADASGKVSATQTLKGRLERAALYDRSSSGREELVKDGTEKLQELQATPTLSVDLSGLSLSAEVGDMVAVTDDEGGTEVTAEVTRTVAKVTDGALRVSVEGGDTRQTRSLTGSSEPETARVLPVPSGGTGGSTRLQALDNLAYLGTNPTEAATDTMAFWRDKGTGYAFYSLTGRLQGQPSQWGFLVSRAQGSEIHQEFWSQAGTLAHYHRKANASTTTMPGWVMAYDRNTLTGASGLIHDAFDGNLTSGTLCFPVFTPGWADGGYMNDSQLRGYLGVAATGWHAVTNGGWTVRYRKFGPMVTVTVTSANIAAGTWARCGWGLPAGHRPPADIVGAAYGPDAAGNNVCRYTVGADGRLTAHRYGSGTTHVQWTVTFMVA